MDKVSIIIPCKEIVKITEKCVKECIKLNYPDFEILVLPDFKNKKTFKDKKVKIIETGAVKPAFKRNIGMKKAKGNFFAFIDDDAYPKKDWLKNAMKYFRRIDVGIVGGPNLTPPGANFAERVSGKVLANYLISGPASVRYKIGKNKIVKELPSCNYISRKEISPSFDPSFLTAEDSKFCFDVAKKGYKILYAKDVIVFHHRRDTLKKHLKQMYIYGRDIAWLTKDDFSIDKFFFSLLSLFVIGFFVGLIGSIFSETIRVIYLFALAFYLLTILFTSFYKNLRTTIYVFSISVSTHFAYGAGWFMGILFKQEKTEKVSWTSR